MDHENDAFGSIQARLEILHEQVNEQSEARIQKHNRILAAAGALAFATLISLSALTNTHKKLDAEAIAQIARAEFEQHLPETLQRYRAYMEREAPRLVGSGLRSILALVPQVRTFLISDLNTKLDMIDAEFEDRVLAKMEDVVHTSRTNVDLAYPGMSDRERINKLIDLVAADFNTNISVAMSELYPRYTAEMQELRSTLVRWQTARPSDLSEEDRIKKEIVETLLKIVLNARAGDTASPR